jgi:hypothetical protein
MVEEEAAITHGEMEAELGRVREQLSAMQGRQRRQARHWFRSGLIALCAAFVLEIVNVAIAATYGVNPTPAICTMLTLVALQSLALGLAFASASRPGERPSFRSLLSGSWTS